MGETYKPCTDGDKGRHPDENKGRFEEIDCKRNVRRNEEEDCK